MNKKTGAAIVADLQTWGQVLTDLGSGLEKPHLCIE